MITPTGIHTCPDRAVPQYWSSKFRFKFLSGMPRYESLHQCPGSNLSLQFWKILEAASMVAMVTRNMLLCCPHAQMKSKIFAAQIITIQQKWKVLQQQYQQAISQLMSCPEPGSDLRRDPCASTRIYRLWGL